MMMACGGRVCLIYLLSTVLVMLQLLPARTSSQYAAIGHKTSSDKLWPIHKLKTTVLRQSNHR